MRRGFFALLIPLLLAIPAFAAEGDLPERTEPVAIISGPSDIAVGRTLVLDASVSNGLGENTTYRWYRDALAAPISRSVEAVYTPERSGKVVFRLVIVTTIDGKEIEITAEKSVTVYRRKIVLIADSSVSREKLKIHSQIAASSGVFLQIVQPQASIPLDSEQALVAAITDLGDGIVGAESTILWADGLTGVQALSTATENAPNRRSAIGNQTIILITKSSIHRLARTLRGYFTLLRPQKIIVTRPEAINPLAAALDLESGLRELQQRDIDLAIVDATTTAIRPWNLLSWFVNAMLMRGVPSQTITLLLMLPVIATILAFFKQVIGLTTFGLYTPSIVALSFLALGWKIGLVFLIAILVAGYTTRSIMRRWRLLYIPKVAIIITVVSITLLILVGLASDVGITFARDTIFVLLIMSTLSENFLNAKSEAGWKGAVIGIGETILASLLCVAIMQWSTLLSLILAYPELIFFTIAINVALGRWTGLRLIEYVRFREVFRHMQEE
ncbi:hypothetical protein AUJ46_06510 [Candidatus Peregrinibacteria bacterium CG1_02_54_53]|nr:MAG: hypothetical protein AUJ46_06510 [Candidatus Peregrinibacteria bacterium CG1_02_54_53]